MSQPVYISFESCFDNLLFHLFIFFSHLSSVKTERNSMACMSASFALVAQPLAQATGGMATLIWDLLF